MYTCYRNGPEAYDDDVMMTGIKRLCHNYFLGDPEPETSSVRRRWLSRQRFKLTNECHIYFVVVFRILSLNKSKLSDVFTSHANITSFSLYDIKSN